MDFLETHCTKTHHNPVTPRERASFSLTSARCSRWGGINETEHKTLESRVGTAVRFETLEGEDRQAQVAYAVGNMGTVAPQMTQKFDLFCAGALNNNLWEVQFWENMNGLKLSDIAVYVRLCRGFAHL
ncbi:hypothetical protein M758_10G162500 [Ceratodon purpureus]|nr:hypothetical protein M758_10G162500 [Ceratodon purpureus]